MINTRCLACIHYDATRQRPSCAAFGRIPAPILSGEHNHTTPYDGDGGIVFEMRPDIPTASDVVAKFGRKQDTL